MSACEECWAKAYDIAVRTGRHQAEVYRELVQQPCPYTHGLPDPGAAEVER